MKLNFLLPLLPDLQPYAARWILKTQESRYLTRAATQGIIEDVQDPVSVISQSMEVQTHAVHCRIILKETRSRQLSGRKSKKSLKKEIMYIPLLETLQIIHLYCPR